MSASSKLEDKEDLVPATITAIPELKLLITDQRIDNFNKVKELQAEGISIKKISKVIGIYRKTVRSYIIQESLSPRISLTSTNIALFTKLILARLNTKGHKINAIIDEILLLEFTGGRIQAYHNINTLKLECKINISSFTEVQQYTIPYIKTLISRKLAKYIEVCIKDIANPDERNYMETILDNIPELRIVRKLVKIFKTMLKRGRGNIKRWIDFIMRSKRKLAGLKTFANGLLHDIKAVENGILLISTEKYTRQPHPISICMLKSSTLWMRFFNEAIHQINKSKNRIAIIPYSASRDLRNRLALVMWSSTVFTEMFNSSAMALLLNPFSLLSLNTCLRCSGSWSTNSLIFRERRS